MTIFNSYFDKTRGYRSNAGVQQRGTEVSGDSGVGLRKTRWRPRNWPRCGRAVCWFGTTQFLEYLSGKWWFIVDLPINKWWFSIVMLVYQRVGCSMMETNHLPRQAASCIRVSFATRATSRASVATRSAHLFHVVVPQPLGEPYHLSLGVRCEVGIWWIYKDTLNTCRDLYMNIFMCVYELVILYIYVCMYI
jgi:hypothetical protein